MLWVTIVEGLRARRKVIGIAMLNPMAAFVTRIEIAAASLDELAKAKEQISEVD